MMDIKKRLAELTTTHAEQVHAYKQAEVAMNNARTNLIKIEGALEILREQVNEPSEAIPLNRKERRASKSRKEL